MKKFRKVNIWVNSISLGAGLYYTVTLFLNGFSTEVAHHQIPASLGQLALLLASIYYKGERKYIYFIVLLLSLCAIYYSTGSFLATSVSYPDDGC